ncbi:hypothetical protein RFI_22028 [Reticulomyxa filosa]|uniref:Uncharacterized protein n=1 Tax=Reticulomyxa filosa TaxID=46433 RepID=X6MQH1_RETFI|nr:hypothetical protein RFI_22028 [Reticulomyxa filosa]|eukprot:ETO15335.1 hypothetical protein RFI_22028 [Reticulomyxa filosa]
MIKNDKYICSFLFKLNERQKLKKPNIIDNQFIKIIYPSKFNVAVILQLLLFFAWIIFNDVTWKSLTFFFKFNEGTSVFASFFALSLFACFIFFFCFIIICTRNFKQNFYFQKKKAMN